MLHIHIALFSPLHRGDFEAFLVVVVFSHPVLVGVEGGGGPQLDQKYLELVSSVGWSLSVSSTIDVPILTHGYASGVNYIIRTLSSPSPR